MCLATTPNEWTTIYSSSLTVTSPQFCPALRCTLLHYYEAIAIQVTVNGSYDIFSVSETDTDTYGFLYNEPFYTRYISYNMIDEDDEGNDYGQFRVTSYLEADKTYILVVTTYYPNTTGAFTIDDEGPESLLYKKTNASSKFSLVYIRKIISYFSSFFSTQWKFCLFKLFISFIEKCSKILSLGSLHHWFL